jgi:hypothetical protein
MVVRIIRSMEKARNIKNTKKNTRNMDMDMDTRSITNTNNAESSITSIELNQKKEKWMKKNSLKKSRSKTKQESKIYWRQCKEYFRLSNQRS